MYKKNCSPSDNCVILYKQIVKNTIQFSIIFTIVFTIFSQLPAKHRSQTVHNIITVIESKAKASNLVSNPSRCPKVLDWMQHGSWDLKPATWQQKRDQEKFMSLVGVNILTHTRKDNLCGNVSADGMHYFRGLCSPIGPRPCCYNNVCENRPVKECTCPDCYDIRELRHAELGTWVPDDKSCPLTEFTPEEACDIVAGSNILFIGDSLMRHFHTALLLYLSGQYDGGALQKGTPESVRKKCGGIFMYTERECRYYVRNTGSICNGRANITMAYVFYAKDHGRALEYISKQADKKRSLTITGIGLHNWLNFELIQGYIKGIYKFTQNHQWPRLIWHAQHYQGLLKSPIYVSQSNENVAIFNKKMSNFLADYNFEVFDTFNMTKGLFSFDGTHYGIGVNRMKALMLIHYIKQQKEMGLW